jgi:hypothetical protein
MQEFIDGFDLIIYKQHTTTMGCMLDVVLCQSFNTNNEENDSN